MYYISQPPGFSLDEHIVNLEDLYAESFKNYIEASTRNDMWGQITALREKLTKQNVRIPVRKNHSLLINAIGLVTNNLKMIKRSSTINLSTNLNGPT